MEYTKHTITYLEGIRVFIYKKKSPSKSPRKKQGEGAMCGGVISESQLNKALKTKDGVYGIMMPYVLPDKYYKRYIELCKSNKTVRAHSLFEKYATSLI